MLFLQQSILKIKFVIWRTNIVNQKEERQTETLGSKIFFFWKEWHQMSLVILRMHIDNDEI